MSHAINGVNSTLASMNIFDCVDSMREREISFHVPVFPIIALTCFPYWRIFWSGIEFSGDYGDLKEKKIYVIHSILHADSSLRETIELFSSSGNHKRGVFGRDSTGTVQPI